jgi:hypothetical protein
MHGPINVKSPNTSKWQMGFNSAFKELISYNARITGTFPNELPLIQHVQEMRVEERKRKKDRNEEA